ncbi:MAG TPA: hypothetical protein VN921_01285 [Chthoniobacterales bacterium]|nr:hypothetical protein [Chthoniobacterales bacterium]
MRRPPTDDELTAWRGLHQGGRGATRTLFGKHALKRVHVHLGIEAFLAKLRRDKEWESACELARATIKRLPPAA